MKKFLGLAACAVFLMGAAQLSASADQVTGFVFKEAKEAVGGSGSVAPAKMGCSSCVSYFGIVALGDCSIRTAMKNGGINNLSHYDSEIVNILGYKKVKIKAYGQ